MTRSPFLARGWPAAPPLLLVALAALFLWRPLFLGEWFAPVAAAWRMEPWVSAAGVEPAGAWNPLQWDGFAQFAVWRKLVFETWRTGTVPLWNPFQFCGTPLLANSQSAPFFPLHLLAAALPVAPFRLLGWLAFVQMSLAGVFTYFWLRDHGLRVPAALTGALAFQFCGAVVTWLQLPSFLAVSCWLPLVLLLLRRALRQPNAGRVVAAGAALGVALLGGHLQIASTLR